MASDSVLILVLEDEPTIPGALVDRLRSEGFEQRGPISIDREPA